MIAWKSWRVVLFRLPPHGRPRVFYSSQWDKQLGGIFCRIFIFSFSTFTLIEILIKYGKIFVIKSHRTLNRVNLLSRRQENKFWNSLKNLAAKCHSGAQIESLVYNSFFLKKHNKSVQKYFCNKVKDLLIEALKLVVAFEEGIKRRASMICNKSHCIFQVWYLQCGKMCFGCGRPSSGPKINLSGKPRKKR